MFVENASKKINMGIRSAGKFFIGVFLLAIAGCRTGVEKDNTIALAYACWQLDQHNKVELSGLETKTQEAVSSFLQLNVKDSLKASGEIKLIYRLLNNSKKVSAQIYKLHTGKAILEEKPDEAILKDLEEIRKIARTYLATSDTLGYLPVSKALRTSLIETEKRYGIADKNSFKKLPSIYALADHARLLFRMNQVTMANLKKIKKQYSVPDDFKIQVLVSAQEDVVTAGSPYNARVVLTRLKQGGPISYPAGIKGGKIENLNYNVAYYSFTFDPESFPVVEKNKDNLERRQLTTYYLLPGRFSEFTDTIFKTNDFYFRPCR